MISFPAATRALPLTKEMFAQLLVRSANPGRLRGCCSGHETDRTHITIPIDADSALATEAFLAMQARRQHYFVLKEPDLAFEYGPYFLVVFYHPELQNYVKEQLHNADGDLWVDLTATENDFKATIISPFDPTYIGDSETFAFADNASPVFTWVKPVHDDIFLQRTLPSLVRNTFGRDAPYWGSCASISLCKGIYLFARV